MDKIQIFENSAIIMLFVLASAHRTAGVYSRCEAGNVNEGETAKLICHFDDDIRRMLLDVHVNRFEPEPVTIFTCAWFGADPDIITAPGVTYDADISNKLTLRISNVSKETFGGSYMCQVAKSLQYESVPCTLNVSGKVQNSSQTTSMISKETTICSIPEQEFHLGAVIGGVFGGLVIVVLISGLVYRWFWRKKKAKSRQEGIAVDCEYQLQNNKDSCYIATTTKKVY